MLDGALVRLAVAATAPFGADVLERLAARHDVAYLLTRPDRPKGRGRRLGPPPAKETAERLGIEVRQPERLEDFDPEEATVVLAAYGALIPEPVLDRALWLNVHPSLLPRWRGAAPIERALMAGDAETGTTIIKLVPELDAGPIAAQSAFAVGEEDDYASIAARTAELGVELLDGVLPEPAFMPQPSEGVTYAERRSGRTTACSTGAARRRSSSTASVPSRRTSARAPSCTGGRSRSGARASRKGSSCRSRCSRTGGGE
ncbi:MAG: methionyl-tRNA formyltransferase [Actinobacteria bacterium]|nr:MAG: methionyl-tRNA formyltransferase [Actinomycetota bacterium]